MNTTYTAGNKPPKVLLQEAMNQCQWNTVSKLISTKSNFSTMDIDTVLETTIMFEQWDIMHACMRYEVSEKLLMAAIILAIDRRNWDTLEILMQQGGNRWLMSAVQSRPGLSRSTLVKLLLDAGVSPDTVNTDGETPIHMAVWQEEWDTASLLLKYSHTAGEIASTVTENGTTLLHELCKYGQINIIQNLLSKGADALIKDTQGNSLLMSVLQRGQGENVSELVKLLLDAGVSPETANTDGETPIHMAVWQNDLTTVRLLLKYSHQAEAIASTETKNGTTLLHELCRYGKTDIILDILSMGANMLITDSQGNSLLMSAMHHQPSKHTSELVKLLLDAGVSPDTANTDGETPIHMAVRQKAWATVSLLFKYGHKSGATASKVTQNGSTWMHHLCRNGQTDIVQVFLSQGADVLIQDTQGNSLLMSAVQILPSSDTPKVVKLLLDAGVSPDTANTDGETPIHMAVRQKSWATVRCLLKSSHKAAAIVSTIPKTGTTLLHELCKYGQTDIIWYLLSKGADALIKDTQGNSLLMSAVHIMPGKNTPQLVKLLLDAGVSPDAANIHTQTPIHKAVWQMSNVRQEMAVWPNMNRVRLPMPSHKVGGWKEADWYEACDTVRLLLTYSHQAGAMLSQLTEKGTTLLHQLCTYGNTDIIRDVLSQGADMLIKDTQGNSLLMSAMECMEGKNASALVDLLLDAGVSPETANTDGETPIHMAVRQEDWDTVRRLLKFCHNIGATASKVTKDGSTMMHNLCRCVQVDIIRDLLLMGANLLITDTRGNSLLMSAMECMPGENTSQLVELLLDAGVNPDTENTDGETPIHMAVWKQQWTTLEQLLDKSNNAAALASRTENGTTMLHRLCEEGQTYIIQILLLKGADPLVTDIHGMSLMMKAIERSDRQMRAVNTSDTENMVRALIKSGMSTHQTALTKSQLQTCPKSLSHSPMWHAVKTGQLHIAKMLYASGACSRKEMYSMNPPSHLKNYEDIKRFLDDICSKPRSLQELCALTISHHLGCGPDRYQRAEGTGLPPALSHCVLHEHVLSHDFLNETPPDPF